MKNINCVFDGACEPTNPGGALGIGGAIFEDKVLIEKYSTFELPNFKNTNNVAEYKAVLWGLTTLIRLKLTNENITIYGDSKLVINQLTGTFKINTGYYVSLAWEAKELLKQFSNIKFEWIVREKNVYADNLSKEELKKHNIQITKRK